jgi:hypothetical protein
MRKLKVSALVFDFNLYPRQQVDMHHVAEMVEAKKAGIDFPPVLIDKKSKRIVDGFHRAKTELRIDGADATIEVVEKSYRSEREMFLDAMRHNANHGRALSSYDRAHAVILAGNLGLDDEAIAGALSITVDRVSSLRVNKSATAGKLQVPIKRTIRHMAGGKLTKRQVETNRKLGGMEQLFYVNQLVMLIESGLLDKGNEDLMEKLAKLHELLGELVAVGV